MFLLNLTLGLYVWINVTISIDSSWSFTVGEKSLLIVKFKTSSG